MKMAKRVNQRMGMVAWLGDGQPVSHRRQTESKRCASRVN